MTPTSDWEEQAVVRYRERLRSLHEQLGPDADLIDIEELLIKHENDLMSDTLEALQEGISPPWKGTKRRS